MSVLSSALTQKVELWLFFLVLLEKKQEIMYIDIAKNFFLTMKNIYSSYLQLVQCAYFTNFTNYVTYYQQKALSYSACLISLYILRYLIHFLARQRHIRPLFRNKKLMLDEMTSQNVSKFAI